jgi:hypothetical protein
MELSSDLTFDALVTEKDSGAVLLNAQDLIYEHATYNYFGMGYYTTVATVTGPTTMRVDNIEITSVPEPSVAAWFAVGLLIMIYNRKRRLNLK